VARGRPAWKQGGTEGTPLAPPHPGGAHRIAPAARSAPRGRAQVAPILTSPGFVRGGGAGRVGEVSWGLGTGHGGRSHPGLAAPQGAAGASLSGPRVVAPGTLSAARAAAPEMRQTRWQVSKAWPPPPPR
jgi:hypothetical protein